MALRVGDTTAESPLGLTTPVGTALATARRTSVSL
jgi:hypothetical protein